MKRFLCLLFAVSAFVLCQAQVLSPSPRQMTPKDGSFVLSRKTWLYPDDTPGAKHTVLSLQKFWITKFHKKLKANTFLPEKGNYIAFYGDSSLPQGACTIRMYPDRIEVRASSEEGFARAEEILRQLLLWKKNPLYDIEDAPTDISVVRVA